MSTIPLKLYHTLQLLLSIYTGLLSQTSISKVQTYEEPTKKAAQYSNIAEHHLKTTRTTMAAGAGGTVCSFALSSYLMLGSPEPGVKVVLCAAAAVAITAAHTHVSNYWRGKAKVPLPKSGDYNDAISSSNMMRRCLGILAVSWGVVGGWYGFRWISG